jgi:excisionase family DNA binding protein
MHEIEKLLTLQEVGRILRVHPQTVRGWIGAGKIPSAVRTPSGRYRIRLSWVNQILNGDLPAPDVGDSPLRHRPQRR